MIVSLVKRIARQFGIDVIRTPANRRQKLIEENHIDTVIDVGANIGQFARGVRDAGFAGPIVSFEPIGSVYEKLAAARGSDPKWTCHRVALGGAPGDRTIHIAANNGESSSLLDMLDRHRNAAPQANYVAQELISVVRLDDVQDEHLANARRAFLKIDVQGFELEVLAGAARILSRVDLLEIEISLVPLYAGQPLMESSIAELRKVGFCPVYFEEVFTDPKTNHTLQLSGIFVRSC